MPTVWGDDVNVTWGNARDDIKESFALVRLFWFFRMVDMGGPDGSDLDQAVCDEARQAAEWFGPILARRGSPNVADFTPDTATVEKAFWDDVCRCRAIRGDHYSESRSATGCIVSGGRHRCPCPTFRLMRRGERRIPVV